MKGFLSIVLHMHLPYVRKTGEWPFGETWFFEAMAETYVPLLMGVDELVKAGINPKITVNITPVLLEQLADDYLNHKFEEYLENKLSLIEKDLEKYHDKNLRNAIKYMHDFYQKVKNAYVERYKRDIIGRFKQLQEDGYIEVITSAATHAYLPLLSEEKAIKAQLDTGVKTYRKFFDRKPRGIWLPEMAYRPTGVWVLPPDGWKAYRRGLEYFLAQYGYEYFFIEYHMLEGGKHVATYPFPSDLKYPISEERKHIGETLRPYFLSTDYGDVAVFARNKAVSVQVWSADWGYPGDYWYREFHRVAPESGMKYWRITDKSLPMGEKMPYEPSKAMERVLAHAEHFVGLVEGLLANFSKKTGETGIVVGAYDAELFGHWWFEGIDWLVAVYKKLPNTGVSPITPSEYLDKHVEVKYYVKLPEGSWGLGGGHWTWWNDVNKWTWRDVHKAERKMKRISKLYGKSDLLDRVIRQAMRELHLLESSDWQFLMTTGTAGDYPIKRFKEHAARFNFLSDLVLKIANGESLENKEIDELRRIEELDNVFSDLNPRVYNEH